jgi:hypothetical protein
MRIAKFLVPVAAAAGLAVLAAAAPAASASTASAHLGAASRGHPLPFIPVPGRHAEFTRSRTVIDSDNWSGYVALRRRAKDKITYVSASFTVPSVNCAEYTPAADGSYVAIWAGLDGWTPIGSETVEQEGVQAYCASQSSAPAYNALWEMYPEDETPITMTVSPGDVIDVSTAFASHYANHKKTSSYTLRIADETTGKSYHTIQRCPSGSTCENSSAEMITERPSLCSGTNCVLSDLADFGVSSASAAVVRGQTSARSCHWVAHKKKCTTVVKTETGTLNGATDWKNAELVMTGRKNKPMATPSALIKGKSFSVTWDAGS